MQRLSVSESWPVLFQIVGLLLMAGGMVGLAYVKREMPSLNCCLLEVVRPAHRPAARRKSLEQHVATYSWPKTQCRWTCQTLVMRSSRTHS